MAQIATATRIDADALTDLIAAASAKRKLFGKKAQSYDDFIRSSAAAQTLFDGDAMHLLVALLYLQEEKGVDYLSAHEAEAAVLTKARDATHLIFTGNHKALRPPRVTAGVLRDYFEAFNEVTDPSAGEGMLEAIRFVRNEVQQLGSGEIVVVEMG